MRTSKARRSLQVCHSASMRFREALALCLRLQAAPAPLDCVRRIREWSHVEFATLLAPKTTAQLLTHCFSAGQIFSYPVRLTWEFTSDDPVRSVFPLWPVYGLPMLLLRWLWIGNGNGGEIPPVVVFWTLRVLMFVLSFVLEDWALHEMVQSPRHRRVAVMLVASSYVTWTYQTHTFSNSIETLAVAWSLVLIQRIVENKVRKLFPGWRYMLTVRVAEVQFLRSSHSCFCGCFRNLQSNYFPRVSSHSWPSFDTPFRQEVCCSIPFLGITC